MNFELATRQKLRYETSKGMLTVEDLWDLPLSGNGTNLDKIAIALSKQLKDEPSESFVVKTKKHNLTLQLKFDVVKHIIDVRLAEEAIAKDKAEAKAKKERIMEIIERKKDQELEGASLEDLQKMVEAL